MSAPKARATLEQLKARLGFEDDSGGVVEVRSMGGREVWKLMFAVDGKHLATAEEVDAFLMDCLEQGRRYLPMGDCEGFWAEQRCPGHAEAPEPTP